MSSLSPSELGVKLTVCDDSWGTLENVGEKNFLNTQSFLSYTTFNSEVTPLSVRLSFSIREHSPEL